MIDDDRGHGRNQTGDLAQGHHCAVLGKDVDALQRIGSELILRIDFENHVILVQCGEDPGNVTLAERIVQGGVDRRRRDAEQCGGRAVDLNLQGLAWRLLIARDCRQLRQILQLRHEFLRVEIEFVLVDVDQGVLILRL